MQIFAILEMASSITIDNIKSKLDDKERILRDLQRMVFTKKLGRWENTCRLQYP